MPRVCNGRASVYQDNVCLGKCFMQIYGDKLLPWWRHQMGTFCELLAICARNSPVTGEFPAQRPVTQSFNNFCAWIAVEWTIVRLVIWDAIAPIMTSLWCRKGWFLKTACIIGPSDLRISNYRHLGILYASGLLVIIGSYHDDIMDTASASMALCAGNPLHFQNSEAKLEWFCCC